MWKKYSNSERLDCNSAPKKKVRGPTKNKGIWNLKSDEKVVVTFNQHAQPIRDEGNELTNFLGTLVRMSQHIGIHYEEWRKVPENKKEDLWSIVKEKFVFEPVETTQVKDWIMTDMSTKWRIWKHELKKSSFDSSLTVDEIVALQTDDRVDIGQFRTLVTSWWKQRARNEIAQSRMNLTSQGANHLSTQKNKGVRPSRRTMYCLTRTRPNRSIVNVKGAKVVEAIKTVAESSTAQETRMDGSPYWIDDDLSKVKGPKKGGNILCVGKFPAAKRRRVHDPQVPILKAEVKDLRDVVMNLVAAVKAHIPALDLSTIISRVNTNMEDNDVSTIHDQSVPRDSPNPNSVGASNHPNNSRSSTSASANPNKSRSTTTSPRTKNLKSRTSPKSGPNRQHCSNSRK